MGQYFDRIDVLSRAAELPARIRFMLDDVMELRENDWVPRQQKVNDIGPRTISQMRWDHMSQVNPMMAQCTPGMMPGMPNIPMPSVGPDGKPYVWFGQNDNLWGASNQDIYTSKDPPGIVMVDDNKDIFGKDQNTTAQPTPSTQQPSLLGRAPALMKQQEKSTTPKKDLFEPHYMKTKKPAATAPPSSTNISLATVMKNEAAASKITTSKKFGLFEDEIEMPNNPSKPAPTTARTSAWNVDPFMPDFSKPSIISPFSDSPSIQQEPAQKQQSSNNPYKNSPPNNHYSPSSNRSMRPGMQTLTKPTMKKSSNGDAMRPRSGEVSLRPATLMPAANTKAEEKKKGEELPGKLGQFTNLTIQEKSKPKKSGPSKKEIDKKISGIISDYQSSASLDKAMQELQSLITSTKLCKMVAKQLSLHSSTLECSAWQQMADIYNECDQKEVIRKDVIIQNVLQLLDDPKVQDIDEHKSCLAFFVGYFVTEEWLQLGEFISQFTDGRHYPVVLMSLVEVNKRMGKKWLQTEVKKCDVDLKTTFPKDLQQDIHVMSASKEQGLAFLFPHLCLQDELLAVMKEKKPETDIIRWIQDNVEKVIEKRRLIHILVTCVVAMATQPTLADDNYLNQKPDKEGTDGEKEMISSMKSVLKHFLDADAPMQLEAIYALQVFCNDNSFPKEMLLRLFITFYTEEIVEEDLFMKWREDLNDTYPGKGKALFQVNSWLQWMEQADEEEEDAEEEG